jgi:hypothetical protein
VLPSVLPNQAVCQASSSSVLLTSTAHNTPTLSLPSRLRDSISSRFAAIFLQTIFRGCTANQFRFEMQSRFGTQRERWWYWAVEGLNAKAGLLAEMPRAFEAGPYGMDNARSLVPCNRTSPINLHLSLSIISYQWTFQAFQLAFQGPWVELCYTNQKNSCGPSQKCLFL